MAETPKHHRQKDLLAYAQNFLDDDERRELEEHLAACADCRKTLDEVRRFLPTVQQALTPPEMSTEEMWANVQRRYRNRPPEKEPFFTRLRVALAAGGAALATTILIVAQPLLHQAETGAMAGYGPSQLGYVAAPPPRKLGIVSSPRRPEPVVDGGQDAGAEWRWKDTP